MTINKYIFIISVGRSGSTLLQNLLNTHDNVLIRGENNNFFYYAMLAYQSLRKDVKNKLGKNISKEFSPWYGYNFYEEDAFLKTIYELGKKYLLGNKKNELIEVLGFKEIRYFELMESQQNINVLNPILSEKNLCPRKKLKALLSFLNITFKPSILSY